MTRHSIHLELELGLDERSVHSRQPRQRLRRRALGPAALGSRLSRRLRLRGQAGQQAIVRQGSRRP